MSESFSGCEPEFSKFDISWIGASLFFLDFNDYEIFAGMKAWYDGDVKSDV